MRAELRLQSVVGLMLVLVMAGCQQAAPTQSSPSGTNSAVPSVAASPKRASAVIMGDPPHFEGRFNPNLGSVPGLDTLEEMLNAGMADFNQNGQLRPQLATDVPSLDNGLWKVLPDGRMETTWKVRPGAVWHDKSPFTSDDLQFTVALGQDKDLAGFGDLIYPLIESTATPDKSTFVATWKGPFVGADTLFTRTRGLPLPRHILEAAYSSDKVSFRDLPYWSDEFVGTGPYKLRELVRGSHLILDANDAYVLGRPQIDVFEVKFSPDANTLITTLLSGAAEITFGARLSIDQALQVQNSWTDGSVIFSPGGWVVAMPQFINPTPQLLLDVRLRRALQHAINRQVIVDDLLYGKTEIDDAPISLVDKDFKDVQTAIVRYPYDPGKVTQIMTELGYTTGSGGMFQDAGGNRLAIEARTNNQLDTQVKAAEIVTDMWKKVGFDINEVVYGQQRVADREYRNSRPAFEILGFNLPSESFALYHSKQIPTPETNWFGQNRTRYSNPDYDALVDQYFLTIPRPARMDVLRNIIRMYTDQVVLLPLAYTTNHVAVGNRFKNVTGRGTDNTEGWNAEQWEYSK